MPIYRLTIITEDQKEKSRAENLAHVVVQSINANKEFEVEKYDKFPNSFKIVVTGNLNDELNHIEQAVELTDRIASPWLISYERDYEGVELIFNKSTHSRFRNQQFNTISWAQLEIVGL